MRLVTLLSGDMQRVVLDACASHVCVTQLRSLDDVTDELARVGAPLIVVDPRWLSDDAFAQFLTVAARFTAPVLFLSTMQSHSARRIVEAATQGIGDVILADREDLPLLLKAKLRCVAGLSAPTRVLRALAAETSRLEDVVSLHTVSLFSGGRIPRDVTSFAERMHIPRRSLHRALARVGLAGASRLLLVARVARTWESIGRGSSGPSASLGGHSHAYRGLYAHYLRLVGLPPCRSKRELSVDAFTERLAQSARS